MEIRDQPKVLQILYSGLGGHASVAFSLQDADKTGKWRHDFLFYGVEVLKPEYLERCENANISYGYVNKKEGLDIASFKYVYKYLRRSKPDIILLHSTSLILVAWLYRIMNSCRIIMVEHNANSIKRKSEWIWSSLGMLCCDKVVYLTNEYKKEIKENLKFIYSERKVSIIHNGIDTGFFTPGNEYEQETWITMISRFNSFRDHKTLIKAFSILLKSPNKSKWRLKLAGDGDTLAALKTFSEDLGISESVEFLGMLNETQIAKLLKRSLIYVHATLAETMSTSIMQALSCGLPVVASDIPGVKNLIGENSGLLFSNGNSEELASLLEELIDSPEYCKQLSCSARKYAESNLSNHFMFEKYNHLVFSVCRK